MKRNFLIVLLLSAGLSTLLTSCLPLAAGAAAGYVAHKEGYRVSNPIHRH